MKKVSEMVLDVSGDLLKTASSPEEMQAHLELIKEAWNIALYSENKRKVKLKRFIERHQHNAPSPEDLKSLEWEMRRIIKQKDKLFPVVKKKIQTAEAIKKSKDEYVVRAYFTDEPFNS